MPTNARTRFGGRPERRTSFARAGRWLGCLLLLTAAGAAHAQNDVVELTTGNRLIGTIRSLYRGGLRFSIAGAGTVNINWSNVELLESARMMDVELASGERLSGAVQSPAAKELEVTGEAGTRTVSMPDVVRIHPIEPLARDRLSGSIDLGLDALGANDDYVVAVPDGRGFRPLGRIHRQGAEEATLHRIRLARPTPPVSRLRIFGLAGDGLYTVGRLRVNPER